MMPFSSLASCSSRSSGSAILASLATLRTVATSMVMPSSSNSRAWVSRAAGHFASYGWPMAVVDLLELPALLPRYAPLVGLDLGEKTIGVAVSDATRMIATPLELIRKTKFTDDANALFKLIASREAAGVIIGLPVNMDGT